MKIATGEDRKGSLLREVAFIAKEWFWCIRQNCKIVGNALSISSS